MSRIPQFARSARGASLAGVLVIVVVLGGLAATAVIGVNAMTGSDTGGLTTTSATTAGRGSTAGGGLGSVIAPAAAGVCHVAADAATAASSAYFASSGGSTYPTTWSQLTAGPSPVYALPSGVVINPRRPAELDGNGWKLVLSGNGTSAPTFACK